jgi:putative membrane protein
MFGLIAHHSHHDDGSWFPYFPLIPLFFIGVWVLLVATVGRRFRRNCVGGGGESVLAERFARGEIDEGEYRQRREVLRRKD